MPSPATNWFISHPNFKQALAAVRRGRTGLLAGRLRRRPKAAPTAVQLRAALSLLGRPSFPD